MSQDREKRILCFGDSNTWGYTPVTGERYDRHTRWPGVLQDRLGDSWLVLEAGLNGRTTVFADPFYRFRGGLDALGFELLEHTPLDLVILALGTNDLQFTDARGAARGCRSLIYEVRSVCEQIAAGRFWPVGGNGSASGVPEILVLSPILVHERVREIDPWSTLADGPAQSRSFARWYKEMAEAAGVSFLDSASFAAPSELDGIHMEPDGHAALAQAVAEKVREIL